MSAGNARRADARPADVNRDVHIGIDLGGTKLFAAIATLDGTLEQETYVAHAADALRPQGSAGQAAGAREPAGERASERASERAGERAGESGAVFTALIATARTLIAGAAAAGHKVRGVATGAPSIIADGGVVVSAPPLGWRGFPLQARMQELLALPVRVDNDVNLAALGEMRFGAGRGARSAVVIAIGTGIGGAVIIDGRLHRGRHGAAGEIGGLIPGRDFLSWRNPEWGALESLASGSGIAARAAPHATRAEDVFAAAAAGEPWAKAIVDETIDHLAVAVASAQALLDPDVIILSGGIASHAATLIPAIEHRLAGALPNAPRLVKSELGYRAGVLGAAALFE